VVVSIENAQKFTAAEDYHQDFYKKNPGHYSRYRLGCGRDARLRTIWGKKEGS
jgi:peptide-methionine (S)-S-oxide reductase